VDENMQFIQGSAEEEDIANNTFQALIANC
jgi:hypothetical protein